MSYVSVKQSADPKILVAAVAINAMVLGVLILSPIAVETLKPKPPITTFDVRTIKPPPPELPDPQILTDAPKTLLPVYIPEVPINIPVDRPQIDTGSDKTDDIPLAGGDGTSRGAGSEVKLDPIVVEPVIPVQVDPPVPVFKTAKRDPRYAANFQPEYPQSLIAREIDGFVRIKILIGADGRVRQAIILSATEAAFGMVTQRQALKAWRFIAATRDGRPVEDWQEMTVKFEIKNEG